MATMFKLDKKKIIRIAGIQHFRPLLICGCYLVLQYKHVVLIKKEKVYVIIRVNLPLAYCEVMKCI